MVRRSPQAAGGEFGERGRSKTVMADGLTREEKINMFKNKSKMRQSKVLNFREDIVDLKAKMNVEQIWIDFGK